MSKEPVETCGRCGQIPREEAYRPSCPACGTFAPAPLSFADFSAANRLRCERDFGEPLEGATSYTVSDWVLTVVEEVGEIAGAVLGSSGKKKRKSHLTVADVGDEIADAVSYLDLLAQRHGLDLATILARKFNRVSERIGSDVRIATSGTEPDAADPAMPPPDVIEAMAKNCACCPECHSIPCEGAMAGACDVASCTCDEKRAREEEDPEDECAHGVPRGEKCADCREAAGDDPSGPGGCPGCGGGCQVACR